MGAGSPKFPDDKTAPERRKNLSEEEIKELELAGGVEGGMQAGSAGGPGSSQTGKPVDRKKPAGQAKPR
ncbi:MAG: hypothetical protein ACTHOI_01530 [Sphingomicrobium sp.]